MAEEQRCQEGHRLCANNCGFFGSPATMNLCSKCYRDLRLNEEQALAVEKSLLPPSPPSSSAPASSSHPPTITPAPAPEPAAEPPLQAKAKGRCGACGKRVGGGGGVHVPLRRHALRGPPVPRAARLHLRLQGGGEGRHRARQPPRQGRQARRPQDLMVGIGWLATCETDGQDLFRSTLSLSSRSESPVVAVVVCIARTFFLFSYFKVRYFFFFFN